MKKITLNDKYSLTNAVLLGQKVMMRSIYKCPNKWKGIPVSGYRICKNKVGKMCTYLVNREEIKIEGSYMKPEYELGEILIVANSCNSIEQYMESCPRGWWNRKFICEPYKIQITDIKIEKLQDISDEDCIKEGIYIDMKGCYYFYNYRGNIDDYFNTLKAAYRSLFNELFGPDVWDINPHVFVYTFELIK